jgi:hypothetical protein
VFKTSRQVGFFKSTKNIDFFMPNRTWFQENIFTPQQGLISVFWTQKPVSTETAPKIAFITEP